MLALVLFGRKRNLRRLALVSRLTLLTLIRGNHKLLAGRGHRRSVLALVRGSVIGRKRRSDRRSLSRLGTLPLGASNVRGTTRKRNSATIQRKAAGRRVRGDRLEMEQNKSPYLSVDINGNLLFVLGQDVLLLVDQKAKRTIPQAWARPLE